MAHFVKSFFSGYMTTGKVDTLPAIGRARTDALNFLSSKIIFPNTPKTRYPHSTLDYEIIAKYLLQKLPESSSHINVLLTNKLFADPSLMHNHENISISLKQFLLSFLQNAHTFLPPRYLVSAFNEYFRHKEGAPNIFIHCALAAVNNKISFIENFSNSVLSINLQYMPLQAFNMQHPHRQFKFLKWLQVQFLYVLYHHLSSTHITTASDVTAVAIFSTPWEIFTVASSDAIEFRALYNLQISYLSAYYVYILQGLLFKFLSFEY